MWRNGSCSVTRTEELALLELFAACQFVFREQDNPMAAKLPVERVAKVCQANLGTIRRAYYQAEQALSGAFVIGWVQ